ncbi:hypothetical protein OAT67_01920 [Bacteriovoracaceae bacterium]|nr:hypothetical protein [Bacteriovoracaceae bacterium]|tara:strand:- start:208246 stop:208920 length:675 start_codon:yes stop_codon:yes gene_type:complete
MTFRNYLPKFYHYVFIFLLIFFWQFNLPILIPLTPYAIILFLTRKKKDNYREDDLIKNDMVYSPVNGKVRSITKNVDHKLFGSQLTQVEIVIPFWKETGLFLPMTLEIKDMIVEKGRERWRWTGSPLPDQKDQLKAGLAVSCLSVNGTQLGLQFFKCYLGFWPELRVIPGDRGKVQVNFGFFPFGGTVVLYLPSNYEILIDRNTEMIAGQTIVAGLPEDIEVGS